MAVWLDHIRVARHDDPAALDRLVAEYDRYTRALASRLRRGHEPTADLEQIAFEALVVTLKRFDPERGIPFPAYATPSILGSIRRHYRDHGWLLRVPRSIHEFATAERTTIDRLNLELGRPPTPYDLAAALDMTVDDLLRSQEAVHARDSRSLDAAIGDGLVLGDQLGGEDQGFERADDRVAAAAMILDLNDRDRDLLRLYFLEERTQTEIAAELGISQMQVSRLLGALLRRLRNRAAEA